MSLSWERTDGGVVNLSGQLTRGTVPKFWQERRQWLKTDQSLQLNLGAVEKVDSAGVALLVQAQRELQAYNQQLTVSEPTQQLQDIVAVSGVGELLSLS